MDSLNHRSGVGMFFREEYAKANTLFGFDLTPDMSKVGAFQLIKQGNLRVEIHFAEALTATINVIMYAEFDNVIEIDRNRQVLDGISLVLIHLSRAGIESHITANITCVFKVGL
jgi:hypothetical protein